MTAAARFAFSAAVTALLLARSAAAAPIVLSTFDASAEGWEVGDFFAATGATAPAHLAAGGNPGGFIQTSDIFGWNAFQAPASFLGDQSAAYGGFFSVDTWSSPVTDGLNYPLVVISDGTTMLQFRTTPPSTSFTHYDVPLLASAGWEIGNTSGTPGPAASEAQLLTVLSGLTFLNVNADWLTGSDRTGLDNACLADADGCRVASPVPEPAFVTLLSLGLSGLLLRRRHPRAR